MEETLNNLLFWIMTLALLTGLAAYCMLYAIAWVLACLCMACLIFTGGYVIKHIYF